MFFTINMSIAYTVSGWNRRRKWKLFLENINPAPTDTVLDVGFNNQEYSASDNFLEKHYPYLEKITALGIEGSDLFASRYPSVRSVTYDGKIFPFADKIFDIVWSNAVIEHVGDEEAQVLFLKELYRVCRGKAFITTPNKYFPIEVHTRVPLLHFLLPKRWFDAVLCVLGKKWATGSYMNLLSRSDLVRLLRKAGIHTYELQENNLVGFTLNFILIFNKK